MNYYRNEQGQYVWPDQRGDIVAEQIVVCLDIDHKNHGVLLKFGREDHVASWLKHAIEQLGMKVYPGGFNPKLIWLDKDLPAEEVNRLLGTTGSFDAWLRMRESILPTYRILAGGCNEPRHTYN